MHAMNRQITKKQYVIIDMIILALVLCVLEAASRWALDFFRREIFTISIVLPMTLIAMMRHGAVGTALAALGGAVYCMLNHAQAGIYIVYIVGNMFIAANLLWFRNSGKQKVVQSKGRIALYVLTGYLLINLGPQRDGGGYGISGYFSSCSEIFYHGCIERCDDIYHTAYSKKTGRRIRGPDGVFKKAGRQGGERLCRLSTKSLPKSRFRYKMSSKGTIGR